MSINYYKIYKSTIFLKSARKFKSEIYFGKVMVDLKTWIYPDFLLYFCKSIPTVCK